MDAGKRFDEEHFVPEGLHRAPSILVVDDDAAIRKLLEHHLKRAGCTVLSASTGGGALELLRTHSPVDLVLLDLKLPDISGLETLREINRLDAVPGVIVMTAYGTMEDAVRALKEGAYDFVNKSATFEDLRLAVRNALHTIGLREEVETLKARLGEGGTEFPGFIGVSDTMKQVMKLVRKVMDSDITVLIEGESGSGKEMIARALHFQSKIRHQPFVTINCAAIPENLLESELFGHARGAFTGAIQRRIGKFEEASEGTIFLDEIGEMGLPLQAKLLRVLQTREVEPIGGPAKKVNVRIVSATNKELADSVMRGEFREDLYYRLAVFPIHLPPLRERGADIPLLVEHFLKKFAEQEEKSITGVDAEVKNALQTHGWPGNVRELENIIYRAVILSEGPRLQIKDFPLFTLAQSRPPTPGMAPRPAGANGGGEPTPPPREALALDEMERETILRALAVTGGNVSKAAGRLKIGRATIYRKFKKYGITAARMPAPWQTE